MVILISIPDNINTSNFNQMGDILIVLDHKYLLSNTVKATEDYLAIKRVSELADLTIISVVTYPFASWNFEYYEKQIKSIDPNALGKFYDRAYCMNEQQLICVWANDGVMDSIDLSVLV